MAPWIAATTIGEARLWAAAFHSVFSWLSHLRSAAPVTGLAGRAAHPAQLLGAGSTRQQACPDP